jgi:ABC-type Mn2+/Zn2+ transport system ATPase subunit
LKLLALARVMISKATIYVLDSPFKGLMVDFQLKVDEILRRRQQDGVSIVITLKNVD